MLKISIQTADALDETYRAGIIHRDLKPGAVQHPRAAEKFCRGLQQRGVGVRIGMEASG